MIQPKMKDDVFLSDVQSAPVDKVNLWWLGQSGFLIQWQKHHLLVDPYLSDSLTKKYANTDKPHVRIVEKVITPERLDFIEGLTSSHNHSDHLDPETILPVLKVNPDLIIVIPIANINFATEKLKLPADRFTTIVTDSGEVKIGPFTLYAIPAAHEVLETDDNGNYLCLSYIIEVGGKTIFHSGDACPYPGLEKRLHKWKIDLAILPINGREAVRRIPGNFTAEEAVQLGKAINTSVIPCHFEMFEFNSVSPAGFIEEARKYNLSYHLMQPGSRVSI